MEKRDHSWEHVKHIRSRYSAMGLLVALSFTLVAFEWRSTARGPDSPPVELGPEDGVEWVRPVVVIPRPPAPAAPKPPPVGPLVIGEPDPWPGPEPIVELGPEELGEDRHNSGSSTDGGSTVWNPVSRMPYLTGCRGNSPDQLDACTEKRIGEHIRRNLQLPERMRGEIYTVVHFEVDSLGRIGRTVCVPRLEAGVEREVDRVIRSLPSFVPADQNGHAVAVSYHIPIRMRRE